MTREEYETIIFGLISHTGAARGLAFDALKAAGEGDFDKAAKLMGESEMEFGEAHKIQTDIIQREAGGEKMDVSLLFVHAQDHLMTGISEKSILEGMIQMYKRMSEINGGMK